MNEQIAGLGRRDDLDTELRSLGMPGATAGRVLAQHRGHWVVAAAGGGEPRLLTARGRMRGQPPVTGDWVAVDAEGELAAVLERRGSIVRRAAGDVTAAQVLAANVDMALLTSALPEPNPRQLERLAALARADDVPVALVFTKADLDPDADRTAAGMARELGIADAVAVSAKSGDGVAVLRTLLSPGSTAVLLGPSGAGKSTLVNALLGEQRQATGEVRAGDGRGRHTTVTRDLIPLPGGALLLDTPGVREVGLWDGAGETHSDIDELAANCRFSDCRHETEPGCAVRDNVDPGRIEAWRKLAREQQWVDDRRAAAREREQQGRSYSRVQREARRAKGDTRDP
ncbi:MAG TPA: ribosome small subunit-dependent GTPase A [Thermoleophilaceae bacterium]|nr:ribosome small subunit-dependent GTPase A [Thermoleophilaceae bacterium]